jgi:hypothetical protein
MPRRLQETTPLVRARSRDDEERVRRKDCVQTVRAHGGNATVRRDVILQS